MKPTAAEQSGMKQQDFEALFSKYRALDQRSFKITGSGRETLAAARAAAARYADPLEDFA